MNRNKHRARQYGYTLLEVLIVVFMLGILLSIAAPGWLSFLQQRQLKTAQEQIQRAKYEAISSAKKNKLIWQVSFREDKSRLQYAIHPSTITPLDAPWQNFTDTVQIDKSNTTLFFDKTNSIWRVQYNHQGNTNGKLGKITIMPSSGGKAKRCVIANTLIGNTRLARDKNCGD